MIRKYHNHKPQTTPWHREEEPLNHHETPGRHIKQNNQLCHHLKHSGGFIRGSFGQISLNFDRSLAYWLPLSRSNNYQFAVRRHVKGAGLICRTNENLSSNLKVLIG